MAFSKRGRRPRALVVGVLGGMGPAAALEFCRRLMLRTPGVTRDQDHLRVILDNNAKIPDRTAAILGHGASPAPAAARSARTLERAGAGLIAIPCNTVHCWYRPIRQAVRVPVLHLIEITVDAALRRVGRRRRSPRLGLLATDGTMRSGLYSRSLAQRGLALLALEKREQAALMRAIRDIKAGRRAKDARAIVQQLGRRLARRGAHAVILGCTETSLAVADGDLSVPVIDSLDALVEETLRRAMPRSKRRILRK